MADLLLTKFRHSNIGPNASLRVEDPGQVLAAMEKLERRMPPWGKADWRWGILETRVQLEDLDKKARAHDTWVQHLDAILAGPASQGDDPALANALARAKTYLTDLEVSFQQMEKECNRLTHHLYHELYGTPNRHAAHGSFRLRLPPKRNLVPGLLDRCEMLMQEPDAAKRTKGVATLLKRLRAKEILGSGRILSAKEPWVAVIVPNGNLSQRKEVIGGMPSRPTVPR